MEIVKLIFQLAGVIAALGFFWALSWLMCILNDACYLANFGVI